MGTLPNDPDLRELIERERARSRRRVLWIIAAAMAALLLAAVIGGVVHNVRERDQDRHVDQLTRVLMH